MERRISIRRALTSLTVLLLIAFLATGCTPKIANNTVVQISYTGSLADGTVFDTSEGGEPLEFVFGVGMMIPGLETGLLGLKVGDTKRIEVKAADAYGERDEAAVQEVQLSEFPADMEIEVGRQLTAQTENGQVYATILEIRDKTVMLDFNFPLAGKDLIFEVEVVGIRKATREELAALATPAE